MPADHASAGLGWAMAMESDLVPELAGGLLQCTREGEERCQAPTYVDPMGCE